MEVKRYLPNKSTVGFRFEKYGMTANRLPIGIIEDDFNTPDPFEILLIERSCCRQYASEGRANSIPETCCNRTLLVPSYPLRSRTNAGTWETRFVSDSELLKNHMNQLDAFEIRLIEFQTIRQIPSLKGKGVSRKAVRTD